MSSTVLNTPENPTPPPQGTGPPGGNDGNDQPRSSSLYLFTFLSTLFLLLVVSTAIVLRSFLLRRRYRLQLQEHFDDIFRQPGDTPGTSRKKNFGAKPKLWDTWVKLKDEGDDSVKGLTDIKPLGVTYVRQDTHRPQDPSSSSTVPQSEEERRRERSSAFLSSLFAHPVTLPRHPPGSDQPGGDSANSSSEISRTAQVSVVISMPSPTRRTPRVPTSTEEEFPNVAIGLTRLRIASE